MLKVETLPETTQAMLKEVTSISPKDLTEEQIGFLKARKDYLRPEQVSVYARVLGVEKKTEPEK